MTDVLRVVAFIAGFAGIGFALMIVWPYVRSLRRTSPGRRPLTVHVVAVSASWILLAGNAMFGTLSRLGGPWEWTFLLRIAGLLIGLGAMIAMLRHLVAASVRNVRKIRSLESDIALSRRQTS